MFVNVLNTHKRQKSSFKFRMHNGLLYDNVPLKIPPCHFRYFHCPSFKTTFEKDFIRKTYPFLVSSRFIYVAENYVLVTVGSTIALLWIATKICEESHFCLFSLSKLKACEIWFIYLIFAFSKICANGYFMVINQSYIN